MMIDKLNNICFIHLHKCGGKTIRDVLFGTEETRPFHQFIEVRGHRHNFTNIDPHDISPGGTYGVETHNVDKNYSGPPLNSILEGHNGVNDFNSSAMFLLHIFISVRDMVETYCSKFSFELQNAGITTYEPYLNDKFKELIRCGTDYNHYKNHVSWPIETQFESWDAFPEEILKFNCGWFSSMLLYQTCLIKNDFGVDIRDYSCPIEYWSDANLVSNVIRLDHLVEDFNAIGPLKFELEPEAEDCAANTSALTGVFLEQIDTEMKDLINEKEKLLQLVYEGKLNHKLRPTEGAND